ncbi:B12-binding domain-containing radical SAM protein [archaeon]|nr:B12-binding domain-containing radical SAM protein [archaeon]
MEKVTFVKIQPPWQYDPYSDPPLGMLSVAEATRKEESHDVLFHDMAHQKELPSSEIYALSASTLEFPGAIEIAEKIKSTHPGSLIIAGGPHFDVFSEDYWKNAIRNLPLDIICRGEGEETMPRALKYAQDARGEDHVISQQGGLLVLDEIGMPSRDLLSKERYFKPGKTFAGGENYITGNSSTIMVSRGCPFSCSFCASPELHKRRVRFRSLEKVEQELDLLQDVYGVSALRWQDDCMPLTLKRINGLADQLNARGIFSRGSARTDEIKPGILDNLWYSGFREIGFGIESAEQDVLDYLHKGTKIETNKNALLETRRAGFKTRAFIMTGLPGETRDSAKYMIDFLEETNPDVVTLTSFVPLPGCDIYRSPEKYGVKILSEDWAQYNIALSRDSRVPWTHTIETASVGEMETNREHLKEYLFNKGKSNVAVYNADYTADIPTTP